MEAAANVEEEQLLHTGLFGRARRITSGCMRALVGQFALGFVNLERVGLHGGSFHFNGTSVLELATEGNPREEDQERGGDSRP